MTILKIILFHILLSFRGLILMISKLFALTFLGGLGLLIFLNEISAIPLSAKIMIAAVGILFISIYWFYDYLIFYCKPKMFDMVLLK